MNQLEEIVKQYVRLHPANNKGWKSCVHVGCDHGKKGPRAAFKFHPNGGIEFNCFNCPPKERHTGFDPTKHSSFSRKLKRVFSDFGIPEELWKPIELKFFAAGKEEQEEEDKDTKSIEPLDVLLPKDFIALKHLPLTNKWAQIAYAYLEARKIDPDAHTFFLSEKMTTKWAKRLIIPFFKNRKLIYYTGRDLTGKAKKKYENPMINRSKVIFNFDYLFEFKDTPLFIVEGVMDALSIPDCVAVMGNEITEEQIEWVNRSNREKVFIPDRIKGLAAAERALDLGWSISTPDFGQCNDVNEALVEFNKLYVLKSINDNIKSGDLARISAGMYCES